MCMGVCICMHVRVRMCAFFALKDHSFSKNQFQPFQPKPNNMLYFLCYFSILTKKLGVKGEKKISVILRSSKGRSLWPPLSC